MWNYRTALHYNSKFQSDTEYEYTSIHEIYYNEKGEPNGFIASEAVVRERGDLALIARAFEQATILKFDDASIVYDELNKIDYLKWSWIEQDKTVK